MVVIKLEDGNCISIGEQKVEQAVQTLVEIVIAQVQMFEVEAT